MNRLRAEIAEEEVEQEMVVKKRQVRDYANHPLMHFFTKGVMTTEAATRALPFILFVAFLGMIYIANMHLAEKNIRDIDKIGKEVKELSWDYKTTKADLAFKSTLSEIEKRTDTLGIKVSLDPPQKITVKEVQDEH